MKAIKNKTFLWGLVSSSILSLTVYLSTGMWQAAAVTAMVSLLLKVPDFL